MATWRAKCWLGSVSGYQILEVQSNTSSGAEQQLRRIYGAEQIINLRQVDSSTAGQGNLITEYDSSATAYSKALDSVGSYVGQLVALAAVGLWKVGKKAVRKYRESRPDQA